MANIKTIQHIFAPEVNNPEIMLLGIYIEQGSEPFLFMGANAPLDEFKILIKKHSWKVVFTPREELRDKWQAFIQENNRFDPYDYFCALALDEDEVQWLIEHYVTKAKSLQTIVDELTTELGFI